MIVFFRPNQQMLNPLLLISLLAALTSCGVSPLSSTTATQPQPSATTKPEAAKTTSLADLLAPNKDNLATDIDGLHIQATKGFHCSGNKAPTVHSAGFSPYDYNLVLASDRLTYDQSEILQMSAFFHSANTPLPSAFRWAEGTVANQQPSRNPYLYGQSCSVSLQITNIGTATIQIPRVALRLKSTPVSNTFVYRLINMCSFLSPAEQGICIPGAGGPIPCGTFNSYLFLGGLKMGDAVGDKPDGGTDPMTGNPCPQLTIAPHQSTELNLSGYGPAFIYTVVPELTLITPQGQQTLTLSTFVANLAFSNQFPCYDLKGNTFVSKLNSDTYVVCV